MRQRATRIGFLVGVLFGVGIVAVWSAKDAFGQTPLPDGYLLPSPTASGSSLSPSCVKTVSSSGKVDISIPAGDIIDLAGGTCGGAGSADTLKDVSNTATFSNAVQANGNFKVTTVGQGFCVDASCNAFWQEVAGPTMSTTVAVSALSLATSGAVSATTNVSAGNTIAANTNIIVGGNSSGCTNAQCIGMQGTSAGRVRIDASGSTDTNDSIDLFTKGAGMIQFPRIANASLLSCTASTEDATHVQESACAWDTTNHALVCCDGTANRDVTVTPLDWAWSPYDPVTLVGTTGDIAIIGALKSAATLQDVNYVVPIAGTGTGTLTTKLSSAANGGGTVFATGSIACNATAGTAGTYTINTAAIPAGTSLHYAITTACTTADVPQQSTFHFSNP